MTDQQIIDSYAAREMTIREVLTDAGYHFSKKTR